VRFITKRLRATVVAILLGAATISQAYSQQPVLPRQSMADHYFGADAAWFLQNIPFFEIDDPEIEQVYYYRWMLYRGHIREIGSQGTTVTEFLDNVSWARQPYTDLNDSASFHLMEGRWLRDPRVVNDLIDHLYSGGGNDRHFSESIAAATEGVTLVTGDSSAALRHLDTMQHVYNLWDDHFDRVRNLYWIEPLHDATEYTIASIDASGAGFTDHPSLDRNRNGFSGGEAYRPSINSYQFANAMAIARLSALAGKPDVSADYTARAERIRTAVLDQLWNPVFHHFTDRFQRSTPFVHVGDFIRGRELVGYVPYTFELPPRDSVSTARYSSSWRHVLSPSELAGPHGLRTVEPTYPRYMKQYRYDDITGQPECQWNGPSWPFQTSQTLTGLANVLNDYQQSDITAEDYLRLLRQYTHQHFLSLDHLDLQEDYDADTGKPIVGLPRSHHYNHSTYIDLVLSGLLGVRARSDGILELNPLLPFKAAAGERDIRFFAVQDVPYHGRQIGIFYDREGTRYNFGRGIAIFIDGTLAYGPSPLSHIRVKLPALLEGQNLPSPRRVDLAVNPGVAGSPTATASSTLGLTKIDEAIDGRMWFFPENANGWSPVQSDTAPWYSVHFAQPQHVENVELYFFSDKDRYIVPSSVELETLTGTGWVRIRGQVRTPRKPLGNLKNSIAFPTILTQDIRVVLRRTNSSVQNIRLIELKAFPR